MCKWPCSSGDCYRQNTFQGAFTKTPITLSFHPHCGKRCRQLPRPLNDSIGAQLPAQADLRQAGPGRSLPPLRPQDFTLALRTVPIHNARGSEVELVHGHGSLSQEKRSMDGTFLQRPLTLSTATGQTSLLLFLSSD